MANKFVIADTHFGHRGIVRFVKEDGRKVRPWDSVEEMNDQLVKNWNETVGVDDVVFVLGDFCINRSALYFQHMLNGKKILIKGNHDTFRTEEYDGFSEIHSCVVLKGIILTHIPVHTDQLNRFGLNVHGHLHTDVVMKDGAPDPRYMCVSVEHTEYKPLSLKACYDQRDACYRSEILIPNSKGNN